MDISSQEEEGKKKVTEVKTFSVPFHIEEIKKNITINTNTPSKPSKEQIINQAIKFHSQGNIPEASKYYQYLINQGYNDPRVFSNYEAIEKIENKKSACIIFAWNMFEELSEKIMLNRKLNPDVIISPLPHPTIREMNYNKNI